MRGRLGAAERTAIPVQSSDGALGEVFGCVAHVLLWFAAVAFDVIKMGYAAPCVYRENCFSVDLQENPMFAGVKQGSKISFGTRLRLFDHHQVRFQGVH